MSIPEVEFGEIPARAIEVLQRKCNWSFLCCPVEHSPAPRPRRCDLLVCYFYSGKPSTMDIRVLEVAAREVAGTKNRVAEIEAPQVQSDLPHKTGVSNLRPFLRWGWLFVSRERTAKDIEPREILELVAHRRSNLLRGEEKGG